MRLAGNMGTIAPGPGDCRSSVARRAPQRREGIIGPFFHALAESLLPLGGGEGGRRPDEGGVPWF